MSLNLSPQHQEMSPHQRIPMIIIQPRGLGRNKCPPPPPPPAYTVPYIDLPDYENPENVTVEAPIEDDFESNEVLPRYGEEFQPQPLYKPIAVVM